MKKLIAILSAVLLLCGMTTVALADEDTPVVETSIVAPEGYTVTPLFDFTALPDGTSTATDLGFWTDPNGNAGAAEVVVESGKLTFSTPSNWGAFPNLTEDQQALTTTANGWGFYVKGGELGGTICAGFNSVKGDNTVLAVDMPIMRVALDGTYEIDVTYSTAFNQGGFYVPENFEGYVYIPFSSYITNGTTNVFDPADGVNTPIYAMDSDITTITYGEFFVYASEIVMEAPTPEPTPEPTDTPEPTEAPSVVPTETVGDSTDAEGGFPVWIVIAVILVVVIVVVVVATSKKKKA